MTNFIAKLFVSIFGNHSGIATFFISMLPVVELKGGIPVGMSVAYFGDYALTFSKALLFAYLGSTLIGIILVFVYEPILNLLKKTIFKNLALKLENRAKEKAEKITEKQAKNQRLEKFFAILAFVAIPLPLTGVWTGSLLGSILKMKKMDLILSIVIGNLIAGIIIATICRIFPNFTDIILYVFLGLVAVCVIFVLIRNFIKKKNKK